MAGTLTRREFLKISGAGLALSAAAPSIAAGPASLVRSVIMLGIDGMDPGLVGKYMEAGLLPNIARLAKAGCFKPIRTTNPPQSPVAWSDVITGAGPGVHGIFDFIARDPGTLMPYFSCARAKPAGRSVRVGGYDLPLSGGEMVNLRRGPTFWNELEDHDVDCTVIRMPANFPPVKSSAKTLSGLGTPDIHGGYGIFTYFTDAAEERNRNVSGGAIVKVIFRGNAADCLLPGPVNGFETAGRPVNVPFKVFVDPARPEAVVSIQGCDIVLREGEWSPWTTVSFEMVPRLVTARGICRFYLRKARGDFGLYVSPVNLDPAKPWMPLSTPPDYSRELNDALGPFYTQSMAEDVKAVAAGVFSDDEYRNQACHVLDESLRMFDREFSRFDRGFFFHYFSCLDMNSHAFWRAIDPGHPLYSENLAGKHGDFLPWLYRKMDGVIGEAMKRTGEDVVLMVVSDHGFCSFRRQFNLNTWLARNGYAALMPGASNGAEGYFSDTDWTRTRAYGLGINSLYINVRGREPWGTVPPAERSSVAAELAAKLKDVRDPANGDRVINNVFAAGDIYHGPCTGEAPDLVVAYNRNYRASWDTVLGKYPQDILLDNRDPWSGDHSVDASLVPGVFMSSLGIRAEQPALSDLAPSILGLFGVPASKEMRGKNLFREE